MVDCQSAIQLGRAEHGAAYERLLAQLDGEDLLSAGRSAAGLHSIWSKYQGIARRDFQLSILPLCWEVLLHSAAWPAWKVTVFLRILWVTPDARSLAPLLWFLEYTPDAALAHDAARAIAVLGRAVVAPCLPKTGDQRLQARLDDVAAELADLTI